MLKCLIEGTNGISSYIYEGYSVESTNISLNEIPLFLINFNIFLNNDTIREKYGFIYDVTICTITVTGSNSCDITFTCRVSK